MKVTRSVIRFGFCFWILVALTALAIAAEENRTDEAPGLPAADVSSMTAGEVDALVRAVSRDVESLRGGKFPKPVPVRVVDEATAMKYVTARFAKFYPPSAMKDQGAAYQALGLLPDGFDLEASVMALLKEQVGGFYDPGERTFFVLGHMPRPGAPIIIAHELTHALDDARFGLDAPLAKARDDSDRSTAIGCLVEGSGTLIMTEYLVAGMKSGTIGQDALSSLADSDAGRAEQMKAAPPVLFVSLVAPYMLGQSFLLKGDFMRLASAHPAAIAPDIDRAFRKPPVSTEEILHPEKYWDASLRDPPRRVKLPDLSGALGEGWKLAATDTMGELGLAVLTGSKGVDPGDATAVNPSAWTNAAAAGWGGDRWQLYRSPAAPTKSLMVLATIWDTAADAAEFDAALHLPASCATTRRADAVAILCSGLSGSLETTLGSGATAAVTARVLAATARASDPK